MRRPVIALLLTSLIIQIPSAKSGTYQSTCPASKLIKIEEDIRKNYKPSLRYDPDESGPQSLETKIRRAAKKCRVPILSLIHI